MTEIVALLDGREVGRVRQVRGRLGFRYTESWRLAEGAYPLSLSMPLAMPEHGHAPIDAFLWGLLPDNEIVLQRWARRFGVSARNAFALIRHVGEDCAGAVQFVAEERLQDVRAGKSDSIAWLTEDDVAARLRLLRDDVAAGRLAGDAGQFSLAGAQPKTALLFDGQRWGVPSGRIPTSHILKPALPNVQGHVENEHVCLNLARAFGLPAARSEPRMFGDQQAIVVERYDRVDTGRLAAASAARTAAADAAMFAKFAETVPVYRVHQEDLCQALGLPPTRKYQQDGGPGPPAVIQLLRSVVPAGQAMDDVATFRDALIFNWLIGGTDAHAKNFSLLLGGRGLVRLAPLYDLGTALVYPNIDPMKARLAMSIGGEYRLTLVGSRHWRRLAAETRLDEAVLIGRIGAMAAGLPDLLSDEVRRDRWTGLSHPVLARMLDVLADRARGCARLIVGG